ncbi:hypothetical protein V4C53_30190 [Paraburkholderia azotifigens]|uniref:hypothetical protein n=1 Tax=Paraburkholderia azotifigens TaxID=2057004 RepID=UPI00317FE3D3
MSLASKRAQANPESQSASFFDSGKPAQEPMEGAAVSESQAPAASQPVHTDTQAAPKRPALRSFAATKPDPLTELSTFRAARGESTLTEAQRDERKKEQERRAMAGYIFMASL